MSETATSQTYNGFEISHPRETLSPAELKEMLPKYGLTGESPAERVVSLKNMPVENLAIMMADMNARLQGSSEALISDHTVTIGGRATIAPEHRYDLFNDLISKIKSTDESINPSRIGDTLALGTVLLHPFHDGNGRTARTIGMIFNEDFDSNDYEEVFHQVTEPRDEARKRGGFRINGYVPYIPEGLDQSNPNDVSQYFDKLLTDSSSQLYTSPYGQAELQTSAT